MRLKLKLISSLSSTTAEEKDVFNLDPGVGHEVDDEIDAGAARKLRLAVGAEDQALDLGDLTTVSFMLLRTTRDITVNLNDGTILSVRPLAGFTYGYLLLTPPEISSITISNDSSYVADVWFYLAGTA